VPTSKVTEGSFTRLLEQLDVDRERAGGPIRAAAAGADSVLRMARRALPEEHADATFDRVARRLAEGVAIANVGAYCYEVARLICLEALKAPERRGVAIDENTASVSVVHPLHDSDGDGDEERRLRCLERLSRRSSRREPPADHRLLRRACQRRIDQRRALAARIGVERDALANRAQRIRNKLEACVSRCLGASGDINRSAPTRISGPKAGRTTR